MCNKIHINKSYAENIVSPTTCLDFLACTDKLVFFFIVVYIFTIQIQLVHCGAVLFPPKCHLFLIYKIA